MMPIFNESLHRQNNLLSSPRWTNHHSISYIEAQEDAPELFKKQNSNSSWETDTILLPKVMFYTSWQKTQVFLFNQITQTNTESA